MENRFENWEYPEIEESKPTKYNWIVQKKEGLELGRYTDIGAYTYINAGAGVVIEDYVQIGGGAKIYSVSTIDDKKGKIVLKRNSKVGANSVILPNVIVGENSIVGALSLVKSGTDIPANEIWAGVPAKKIGDIKYGKQ
jgi:acetyltransferase-like isoleucine patch superfamily enzyme